MLLALDIGNSNIVIGVSENDEWLYRWRIRTDDEKTVDEYRVHFRELFAEVKLDYKAFDQIIICSVVPQLTQTINEVLSRQSSAKVVVLNNSIDTGIAINTKAPESVGADLIAGVTGAYELFQDDCIVVDFGTATTVMAAQNPGELVGGAICAGLKVTIEALVGKTAQLSQIPLELPPSVVGENTMEAMQSGLVLGHMCMIEGLIDRLRKKLNAPSVKTIATGGLSPIISSYTEVFDQVDPMLTLDGLRLIINRHQAKG